MKRSTIILGILAVIILGAGGFLWWNNHENRLFNQKVALLQGEIISLQSSTKNIASTTQTLIKNTAQNTQNAQTKQQNLATVIASQKPANTTTTTTSVEAPSLTSAVAKASPAVVSVVISQNVPTYEVTYENPFGDRDVGIRIPVYKQTGTKLQKVGAGTGMLITSDGYVLTNRHVVFDPNAEYTVLLSDGTQKVAQVMYRDQTTDIAIMKIPGTYSTVASIGDSSKLALGQTVAAIGNALGEYNNTVSTGIISGLDRSITAGDEQGNTETLTGIIQTDAAINPGNSGGPLIDLYGNVVGINVATVQGSNSIGFSIPINAVKSILTQYK